MEKGRKSMKSKDFLSQIPEWEGIYKKSRDRIINYNKKDWFNAKAHFTKHNLKILNEPVMEDWEMPYMKDLAKIVTKNGGIILELGYGMGISAKFIQKSKIKEHIIIEANKEVASKARKFAKNARYPVKILEGLWENVINQIKNNSIDGILFDTYPLSDLELYQNHFNFFPFAYKKLKSGGIFTYYSDEIKDFGKVHIQKLKKAGFKLKNIKSKITKVEPPRDCQYWKAKTILAPIIIK